MTLPRLYTVAEVAAWAHVDDSTIYRAIERGDLPHVRFGKASCIRIPEPTLLAWLGTTEEAAS